MRLFGILLIVVNLLAGAGFVYLATQDWKGRQEINAAGLRHVLILHGLPLEPAPPLPADGFHEEDAIPFVVPMAGGESTKTINKKLLAKYFSTNAASPTGAAGTDATAAAPTASKVPLSDNSVVTNQIDEVKRVQAVIKAELAKAADPAAKLALLRGWLVYQAENYDTRVAYLTGDAAALEAALDARFAAVLNPPQSAGVAATTALPDLPKFDPKELRADLKDLQDRKAPNDKIEEKVREINKEREAYEAKVKQFKEKADQNAAPRGALVLDETERRTALTHLLVHLDQDPVWQKRVIVVVGLRRYVRAVTLQVQRIADMTAHVELWLSKDQAAYSTQETALREKATQYAERSRAVAEEKAQAVALKNAADDAVNRRRTQIKDLVDQLTKVKNEVDELLVRQSGIEQQLYDLQREVGLTLEDVYRLEALLDRVERARFGLSPRPEKP